MGTRIFLAVVGGLYVALAAWCTMQPERTSQVVGLSPTPGQGQSEYLAIYGGLQTALGLLFLLPLLFPEYTRPMLLACLLVHGSLVAFRTLSLLLYTGMSQTTYMLSVSEWVLFLGALAMLILRRNVT